MGFKAQNDDDVLAEINVTPLVDVMLVLLVIFMISAPLMYNGITLKLPKTQKVSTLQLSSQKIILSIDQTEDLFIDGQKVLRSELIDILNKLKLERKTQDIYLRADERVRYGVVAKSFAYLKANGITNVSLITDIEK